MRNRPARSTSVKLLAALLAAAAVTGCDESDDSSAGLKVPTSVGVLPEDFLGDVACSLNEGALKAYVVQLTAFEDLEDTTPFTLGASFPTPCSHWTLFQKVVVAGQLYIAEIDGYDRPVTALTPFGEATGGSRLMFAADTGEPVPPRWTTRCGTGPATATQAVADRVSLITSCDPLAEAWPSPTAIALSATAVLGDEPCSVAESFDISPQTSGLPPQSNIPCDAPPVVYEAEDGPLYRLYVKAETFDGSLKGAMCFAEGVAGQTVMAQCQPLSATGAVSLDLGGLTDGGEPICPLGYHYEVSLDSETLNLVPLQCGVVASIGPLDPADYTLDVAIFDAAHELVREGVSCSATVQPGLTSEASCSL